jgi:hypothetical protein
MENPKPMKTQLHRRMSALVSSAAFAAGCSNANAHGLALTDHRLLNDGGASVEDT